MSIWIFLWLVVSCILLGFTGWTFWILLRQKKAWKDFASEHELNYEAGGFNVSPRIEGRFKGYRVGLFTGEHVQEDGRNNRKLTAIEVELEGALPMQGAIGSEGMGEIVRALEYDHNITPSDDLPKSVSIRVDEPAMFERYLTAERVKGLSDLMKVVNAWVIFIFVRNRMLLRLDMPNPLQDPKKMSVLLGKMVDVAKLLELADGEMRDLEKLQGRNVGEKDPGSLDLDEVENVNFELEEDDDDPASDANRSSKVSEGE